MLSSWMLSSVRFLPTSFGWPSAIISFSLAMAFTLSMVPLASTSKAVVSLATVLTRVCTPRRRSAQWPPLRFHGHSLVAACCCRCCCPCCWLTVLHADVSEVAACLAITARLRTLVPKSATVCSLLTLRTPSQLLCDLILQPQVCHTNVFHASDSLSVEDMLCVWPLRRSPTQNSLCTRDHTSSIRCPSILMLQVLPRAMLLQRCFSQ